ncbi:hypothetical protein C8F01DRAFT_1088689 [Mycena amicta]|nr:hypothetical protein C8F01DRAFT_1089776 [Mycena amicta]KAJ7054965.1 hypothetical protein C8F01DRAFT_1088689 [Mycena amicta]
MQRRRRIPDKHVEMSRNGQLGRGGIEHLSPVAHLNQKSPKKSGILVLGQQHQVSVLHKTRTPRRSPVKSRTSTVPRAEEITQPDFVNTLGAGSRKRVLPALVQVYLTLLQDTSSLRNVSEAAMREGEPCSCSKRTLNVTVIRWDEIEEITLRVCSCSSSNAPTLLLQAGLFACSPKNPTLAVDVRVLDFVMELSLNVSPNNTAFCKTLETTLAKRGFKLDRGERLRIRFGNALQWFIQVVVLARKWVEDSLQAARTAARDEQDAIYSHTDPYALLLSLFLVLPSRPPVPVPVPDFAAASAPAEATGGKRRRPTVEEEDEDDDDPAGPPSNPFPEPAPRTRPSDYLIAKCPQCFAGLKHDHTQVYDVAVCIDGNFTQKRRKQRSGDDPARTHPDSVFIPRSTAKQMEAHVDGVRATHRHSQKRARVEPDLEDDDYEGDLKVPRSGLDACEASFKAADESRQKASTKFFAQTGLMALCGRKQYYALLLLEMLFQHLPADIIIATLYDIACQTERSCVKWDFLDRYKDRIAWAVSIFHAFAHIWACQLIYHPQKCLGFGEENGECAERVWNSIQHLIAYLRVCGYHQRNFVLDFQLQRNGQIALRGGAAWLLRRTLHCEQSLRDAQKVLKGSPDELEQRWSEEELQQEWEKQVAFQTRPLPRRSKTQATTAINSILAADRAIQLLQKQLGKLELSLPALAGANKEAQLERIEEYASALEKEEATRKKLERLLGERDRVTLKNEDHQGTPFTEARLTEDGTRPEIERSVRRSSSAKKKNEHASSAIKKREPGIKKLVKSYNTEVAKIEQLIKRGKVPEGTIAPERLVEAHIFELDIDDAIWLDVGLTDEESPLPEALLNPDLRKQIRALLQKRRCEEESHRLKREHGHLRIWFATEWQAVERTIQECDEGPLRYQLQQRQRELLDLYLTWKSSLDALIAPPDVPEWGPSPQAILGARLAQVASASAQELEMEGASDVCSDEGVNEKEEEDEALISILSTLERADNSRQPEVDDDDDDDDLEYFSV